jgi:exodeoxyribonuclease VII large subunit
MAMLEARRKALEAEGLFAAERKRRLPYLPEVIGVVTSPSGAVIRDILHRLRERFPRPVLLWPVTVQGPNCAAEVAAAIRGFNAIRPGGPIPRPDLLIVARGGGSIEDLWGFNEEVVVRAAAASAILLGVAFLGEVLQARQVAGMALIALGLAAIDGRPWRAARRLTGVTPRGGG